MALVFLPYNMLWYSITYYRAKKWGLGRSPGRWAGGARTASWVWYFQTLLAVGRGSEWYTHNALALNLLLIILRKARRLPHYTDTTSKDPLAAS